MGFPVLGFGYGRDACREELLLQEDGLSVGQFTTKANDMKFAVAPDGFEFVSVHSTALLDRARLVISATIMVQLDSLGDDIHPVIITDWIFDQLSPETQRFFILHEVGHHLLGHVGEITRVANDAKRPRDLQAEIEADRYAATIVGPTQAIAALDEARLYLRRLCFKKVNTNELEQRSNILWRNASRSA